MKFLLLVFLLIALKANCQVHKKDSATFAADTTYYSTKTKITLGSESVYPCPMDTIKGILFWNTPKNSDNYGNWWNYGYWIGKCGPMAINGEVTFIPGVMKITQHVQYSATKKWVLENTQYFNEGFRDANWKKIPARQVYGLIVIRDTTTNTKMLSITGKSF